MNKTHHLRKNDVICAFGEFITNFIGKWKPPLSLRAAIHRRVAPMRRNRELGNLFHNLSASKKISWLALFLNGLQMRLKQKKTQVPRLFKARNTNATIAPIIAVLVDDVHAVFTFSADVNLQSWVSQQPGHVACALQRRA